MSYQQFHDFSVANISGTYAATWRQNMCMTSRGSFHLSSIVQNTLAYFVAAKGKKKKKTKGFMALTPGANVIKLFCQYFMDFRNKLEFLSLSGAPL